MTGHSSLSPAHTAFYTAIALIAFAANSVLCRLALGDQSIDAASFTVVRLVSGCIALLAILQLTRRREGEASYHQSGSWRGAAMLFLYAVAFSFAYITLSTGTGALILFGAVQLTIILVSLFSGQRLSALEWLGVLLAFAGFVYLVLPGVSQPSLTGFILMTIAGIAWGLYTLNGRGSKQPLLDTALNFTRTVPLIAALALIALASLDIQLSFKGTLLAVLSGAIASGVGYAIWYRALGGLTATQAGVVQLLVPVIAALGGVVFVAEALTLRLIISSAVIIGGIALVILSRAPAIRSKAAR